LPKGGGDGKFSLEKTKAKIERILTIHTNFKARSVDGRILFFRKPKKNMTKIFT